MKIVTYPSVAASDWNTAVERSSEAWLFHRYEWIAIEARFFTAANWSFAISDESRVIGVHSLYVAGPENGLGFETIVHSGIHRHAGLALIDGLAPSRIKAARAVAMRYVLEVAEAFEVDRVHTGLQTASPVDRLNGRSRLPYFVRDFGFQLGLAFGPNGMAPCPNLSTVSADQQVPLDADDDEMFKRLDDRYAVRRAQKVGLQWTIEPISDRLDDYIAVAHRSAVRTGETIPPLDYYNAISDGFDKSGRSKIAMSWDGARPVAGSILIIDKGVVSYLAGVSDPDALDACCNDHLQWETIRWARQQGHEVYRLGPSFPEVPRDWPIARVSAFKTKFGGQSVPMTYGSLFRRPENYLSRLPQRIAELEQVGRMRLPAATTNPSLETRIVTHLLSVFGIRADGAIGPLVLDRPGLGDAGRARRFLAEGRAIVALRPNSEFTATFDVATGDYKGGAPLLFNAVEAEGKPWGRLRTLHRSRRFRADAGAALRAVVTDAEGASAWAWRVYGEAGILFVGTDLASDLIRYRQGDPSAAANRPSEPTWGIAGERPLYLFERQLAGEVPNERHADWWCETLADALVRHGGAVRQTILPGGAPGAIVITGDDDQAYLETYARQRELLGPLPVTYFLHPLTRHTRTTLAKIRGGWRVELGLHPDALEAPQRYDELFAEQSRWFDALTGQKARTVRNHGFLNDGYWGHAKAWRAHGIIGSANLPGLDGRMLNGSLLPARLALDGALTEHWSLLTAIGDGIVFIHGWDDLQSAACVLRVANEIRQSGIPGVIVLNLHPQNVEKTVGMHKAAREVAASGFIAWTFAECLDWFAARDAGDQMSPKPEATGVVPMMTTLRRQAWQRYLRRVLN